MKNHKKISVVLVAVTALLTCRQASAQYMAPIFIRPWFPDVCGGYSDAWSAKCHRDDSGNMIDGRTGDVYDKSGNFLRHGGAKSQDQPRNDNNGSYSPSPDRQMPESERRALATSAWKKGTEQLQKGNYKDAVQTFTVVINLQPSWAEAYASRGFAYVSTSDSQNWQSAVRDSDQAIRLNPNLVDAYGIRGTAYSNLAYNNPEYLQNALNDFSQVIRLKPNWINGYLSRSMAYYNLGDLQNALRDCNQAIRLKPNFAPAYDNRAFVFYDQGNMVGAIGDWEKALSLDSKLAEPHLALAVASYKQGKESEARRLLAKAIQLDRRYYNVAYLKVEAHWSSKILKDATALFQNKPLANQSSSSNYQATQSSANIKTQPEEITGVGLQFNQDKNTQKLIVVSTIDGTPASSSGILPKDTITQIDGVSTQGMTSEQAIKLIRGTAGTDVTLIVLRNGQLLKFSLTRVKFTTQAQKNNP
jgi:tetratricopeptide (TPR) repeat protein